MRIDKYLKVARVLKRRVVAKELAENDRLLINGRIAKAGTEVKVGDTIRIEFGNSSIAAKVLNLSESCKKEDAATMYEMI